MTHRGDIGQEQTLSLFTDRGADSNWNLYTAGFTFKITVSVQKEKN